MRINDSCAECLYDKQQHLTDDKAYLNRVKEIIDNRDENDTSPYLNIYPENYNMFFRCTLFYWSRHFLHYLPQHYHLIISL